MQSGEHAVLVAELLNEVSRARVTLLNADQKAEYDEELRRQQTPEPVPEPTPPPIPVVHTPAPTPVVVRGTVTQEFPVSVVQPAKRARRRKPKEIWKRPAVIGVSVVGVFGVLVLFISMMSSGDADPVAIQATANTLPTSLREGLVAYYPFNGNANDESGNGHHGTTMGGETFVADRYGNSSQAFSSGSNNSYITVPDHNDLDLGNAAGKEMTISLWFNGRKENGPIHSGKFVTKRGIGSRGSSRYSDYYLWNSIGENGIIWGTGRSSATGGDDKNSWMMTGVIPPVGVWHHLVANYNLNKSGGKKVFLNGALIQQGGIGKKNASNNQPLKIGYWPGFIDDIRIYNRALSEAEVKALYEFEKP
jgi:hypothetical protein